MTTQDVEKYMTKTVGATFDRGAYPYTLQQRSGDQNG